MGTHHAAVLQLPLQQAVQGEGDDVVQILHLERGEMGTGLPQSVPTPERRVLSSWDPPSSAAAPGRVKQAGSCWRSRLGLAGAGCKMSDVQPFPQTTSALRLPEPELLPPPSPPRPPASRSATGPRALLTSHGFPRCPLLGQGGRAVPVPTSDFEPMGLHQSGGAVRAARDDPAGPSTMLTAFCTVVASDRKLQRHKTILLALIKGSQWGFARKRSPALGAGSVPEGWETGCILPGVQG